MNKQVAKILSEIGLTVHLLERIVERGIELSVRDVQMMMAIDKSSSGDFALFNTKTGTFVPFTVERGMVALKTVMKLASHQANNKANRDNVTLINYK